MNNHTLNSYLGEISLIKELTRLGWEVYTSENGKSKFDVIGYHSKYGLKTFQVKSLLTENNEVMLRSVRANKTANKIKLFDKNNQDYLVVYSLILDKLYFFISKDINNKSTLRVNLQENLGFDRILESSVLGTKEA